MLYVVCWISNKESSDGRQIMKQFEELDEYVILNENQQATTKYDTAIDITILHASLAAHSQWKVMSCLVIDHFGICTTISNHRLSQTQHQPRWMLHKVDWSTFTKKVNLLLSQTNIGEEIKAMAYSMTTILIDAANVHIPNTSTKANKRMYWCYDPNVQAAKRSVSRSIKMFRKNKNDPKKFQMLEDSEVYATACNTAKNAYWNKWITEA